MDNIRKGHKTVIILSAGLALGIMVSMIMYYAGLVMKDMYRINTTSLYNIVTGLILSSAPLLVLIISNLVLLKNNKIEIVSTVSAVTLAVYIAFFLIDIGKDFAFLLIGAMSFYEEIVLLAIVLFFWHALSVIPMIMTLKYCNEAKKIG